ncbi:hypothetical protein BLAT2472_10652 [Burkholderia latens]
MHSRDVRPERLQNTVSAAARNPAKPRRAGFHAHFAVSFGIGSVICCAHASFRSFQARLDSQSAKRSGRVAEG